MMAAMMELPVLIVLWVSRVFGALRQSCACGFNSVAVLPLFHSPQLLSRMMEVSAVSVSLDLVRDPKYYFPDGNTVILVENTLFNVGLQQALAFQY
jgi:hypothetical protein